MNRSVKPIILQKLDLSDNLIASQGGLHIHTLIWKNRSLTSLNVSKNFIDANSGSLILKYLKSCAKWVTLQDLNIEMNQIGERLRLDINT